MTSFKAITDVITNPKQWPEVAKMPGKWLWHEVCHFKAPLDASTASAKWIEISARVARAFIIFAPIGLASFILIYGACKGIQGISRFYLNSSELQKFNAEVKRLEEDFFALLKVNGLPGLREGPEFITRIDALVQQSKQLRVEHKTLNQIEFQFNALYEHRHYVINGMIPLHTNGVIAAEDRGNCFYDTSRIALELYADHPSEFRMSHEELREKIALWCSDNYSKDEHFRGLVDVAIGTYIGVLREEIKKNQSTIGVIEDLNKQVNGLNEQMDTEQIQIDIQAMEKRIGHLEAEAKAESYFVYASRPNFWAGNAECYALAKMYNICLTIRREGVDPQNCEKYNADSGGKPVEIWYDGRHFQTKIE